MLIIPSTKKRKREPARGKRVRTSELQQISCYFDSETFDQIRELADRNGASFAEQTRQLVEFGLETVEEKQ